MIFNVIRIFKDNYSLLYEDSSRGHVYFWLFFAPLIVSLGLIFCGFKFNENQFNNLINFIAIIVGFLINAAVILISMEKSKGSIGDSLRTRSYANIFYSIIIGIFIILLTIIKPSFENSVFGYLLKISVLIPVLNFSLGFSTLYYLFLYSLFIHFIIMILVIIKAFYALYK